MSRKTYGHAADDRGNPVRDKRGKIVVTDETYNPRKGSLDFEGTTKRRFGLGDSIRTLRAGR